MAIAEASKVKEFTATLKYVARKRENDAVPATLVYTSMPEALGEDFDIKAVAQSMERVATRSSRVQKPCYHISLSPSLNDLQQNKLATVQDWSELVETFLGEVGLQHHQAIAFLHKDAETEGQARHHVHIVVNRVNEITGTAVPTSWDYYRFQTAVRRLENYYDLEAVSSSWEPQHKEASMPDWNDTLIGDKLEDAEDSAVGPTQRGPSVRTRGYADDPLRDAADGLQRYGQQLQSYEPNEIDGLTIAGTGMTAMGTGLLFAATFRDALEQARKRYQGKELQSYLDRLGAICDRTTRLEAIVSENFTAPSTTAPNTTAKNVPSNQPGDIAQSSKASTSPTTTALPDTTEQGHLESPVARLNEPEALDPLIESIIAATGRVDQLDLTIGRQPPKSQFKVNPEQPINQQLEAIGKAIAQLEKRLDGLEERLQNLLEQQLAQDLDPEAIAQKLSDYAEARATVYGISKNDPIATRTLGTITMTTTETGRCILVSDDQYGIKFSADEENGQWQIATDDLSLREKVAIAQLPDTAAGYLEQANGKEIVRAFQILAPREFARPEGGQVRWQDEQQSFSYTVDISTQLNGEQTVIMTAAGEDRPDLQATISRDGAIRIKRCAIPSDQVDGLVQRANKVQQQRARQSVYQPKRTQPNQQDELQ